MSHSHDYALTELSASASHGSLSRKSRISNVSGEEAVDRNAFADQDRVLTDCQPLNPYEPHSASLSSDTKPRYRSSSHEFIAGWGWEIAAWLLAAVSLVALLILFSRSANHALRQWKSGLTPSAVVAILSQIGQTAILAPVTACICQSMWLWLEKTSRAVQPVSDINDAPRLIAMQGYDDGGRGPIGSLLLLVKHPTSLLVWLGTISTFLIILYGTFTQQTLQLPTRQVNGTDPGFVARSLQYQGAQTPVRFYPEDGGSITYSSVADQMIAAIADGLLRNVSRSDILGSCPTGNCTFEDYQTLGVCSEITDVSSTITSMCDNTRTPFHLGLPGCNYSVPEIDKYATATGTNLTTTRFGQTLWVGASYNRSNDADQSKPGPRFIYPNINTLVQFYVIYVPDLSKWATFDLTHDHKDQLVALQATLNLCLYTYHTTMEFGVTNTTEIGNVTDIDWQIGSQTDGTLKTDTVTAKYGSETFGMNYPNVVSFNKHLAFEIFTGHASFGPTTRDKPSGGNLTTTDYARRIASSIYGSPSGIPGLSILLDNLAVSMTNGLRDTSDLPANVSGTSTSFEVYIQIQWAWMTVPIATVLLSLLFLLLTISLSRRHRIPAWRSSVLALMLSLGTELRSDVGGSGQLANMEEKAKNTAIRLETGDEHWHIVKAD